MKLSTVSAKERSFIDQNIPSLRLTLILRIVQHFPLVSIQSPVDELAKKCFEKNSISDLKRSLVERCLWVDICNTDDSMRRKSGTLEEY